MLFISSGKLWTDKHGPGSFKVMAVVMTGSGLEWTLPGISFWFVSTLFSLISSYAYPTWRRFSLRPLWLSGRSALFLHLPPMVPIAGDLPCVHYSDSAASDPGLAVKGKFTAEYLLMSSLFFMVYLVYHRSGTTWYLPSCLWPGTMYNPCLVFSFYMSFIIHYVTVELRDVFEHLGAAWEWSMTFWGALLLVAAVGGCIAQPAWPMWNPHSPGNSLSLRHLWYWCLAFLYYFIFAKCFPVIY